MQAPRPQPSVVVTNSHSSSSNAANKPMRPLSVAEALPFTPLTTSVSSAHDRIPLPEIGRVTQPLRITTPAERRSVQRIFTQHPFQEIQSKLEILLDPSALAEIKFKAPLFPGIYMRASQSETGKPPFSNLSMTPAARLVLDTTDIDYRCTSPPSSVNGMMPDFHLDPSPSTPSTPKRSSPSHIRHPSLPTPAVSRSPEGRSQDGPEALLKAPGCANGNLTPTSAARKAQITVEVPALPNSVKREDYIPFPNSPKRRKLNEDGVLKAQTTHLRAQKDIADAALLQCQNLLLEIFEAQDQLEPDTSLSSTPHSNAYFEKSVDEDDQGPRLSNEAHSKLQSLLKQLIEYKNFSDLSSEHIRRLQQLCEEPVEATQNISLKVSGDLSDDELSQWHGRIRRAENGAAAAATICWTMIGSPHDEKMVSPDVIRWLPNILINLFENCLVPVAESRGDSRDTDLFRNAAASKDELKGMLQQSRKLLDLVANLCVQVRGAEEAINATEFLAAKLIFVENAKSEKESVLGLQTFEIVRKTAMGALAKVFAKFPKERSAILDEILSSMDKLPSTSKSARQYSTASGKIQLISALIMQLVQTTASECTEDSNLHKPNMLNKRLLGDTSEDEDDMIGPKDVNHVMQQVDENQNVIQRLLDKVHMLYDNGVRSAQEVVSYLVRKASTSTKTGDQPYRNLLDLFVDDLLEVLHLTEWPAAELLLRILAVHMIEIARNDQTASAKSMALESLGKMGSAISTLRASIPSMAAAIARESTTLTSQHLAELADAQAQGGIRNEDLIAIDGPLRLVYQALCISSRSSLQMKSARGFYLAQWAKTVCMTLKLSGTEAESSLDEETFDLVKLLLEEISAPKSQLEDLEDLSATEIRLTYALAILNQGFGRRFAEIVKTLSSSFTSEQAQVRSRSLKSVISILETDSSLLDRDPTLMDDIFRCVSDDSAMVRDSALSLIAKIIVWKPIWQEKGIRLILDCSSDSKIGVQKRSLGHLRDIYLRESNLGLQAAVAETVMRRTADSEDTVADLAKRTLTEIWITSHLSLLSRKPETARAQVAINDFALLLVKTIAQNSAELTPLAEDFFRTALKDIKVASQILELYTIIATSLFDSITSDSGPLSEGNNKEALLLTLTVLANADARTIDPGKLSALRPYLGNLMTEADLQLFRPVVAIFRVVLPHLSVAHKKLLEDIHLDLMKIITKLQRRTELDEVLACLWTIHDVIQSTDKLANLTVSVLSGIISTKAPTPAELSAASSEQAKNMNTMLNRKRSYVRIAGSLGKHFDLDSCTNYFARKLPQWEAIRATSLAGYMAKLISPLTDEAQPATLRLTALESLGSICQSWPGQFKEKHVYESFSRVFVERRTELELSKTSNLRQMPASQVDLRGAALRAFGDLLGIREESKRASAESKTKEEQQDLRRLGGTAKTSDNDAAVSLIAQQFLQPILQVAMANQDEKALLAVKVIASINRQGLVHPKQCLGALIALETSIYPSIAETAFESHQMMHGQHESIYDREYIKAMQDTFLYQKDVVGDSSGATRVPYRAKLWRCFDIIKTGQPKNVKKFLSNLVTRSNVEISKMDISQALPDQMLLTRFIVQNLAFFEYGKIDELLHTIHQFEIVFGKTGAEIAQTIETTLRIDGAAALNQPQAEAIEIDGPVNESANSAALPANIDPAVLKRLATAATMMTMLWEARSYLKRQYGINQDVRQVMNQMKQAKEAAKPPMRAQGVTGDRFWNVTSTLIRSLESSEAMMIRCQEFSALMTIDDEVKVAAEDDDEARARFSASVDVEDLSPVKGRGRKRKSSVSTSGTPKKKKGRPNTSANVRRGSTGSRSSREDPDADFEG